MKEKHGSIVPGVIFIIIGLWLLAKRSYYFSSLFSYIIPIGLAVLGLYLIQYAVRYNKPSSMLWGVVQVVIGLFFILRNFDVIPYFYADEYWPVFLLAFGFGFLGHFIIKPSEWGVLIPAFFLLLWGMSSMHLLHDIFWEWDFSVRRYWPILLILIGGGVVISGLLQDKKGSD